LTSSARALFVSLNLLKSLNFGFYLFPIAAWKSNA
jgi:hypothetical protein